MGKYFIRTSEPDNPCILKDLSVHFKSGWKRHIHFVKLLTHLQLLSFTYLNFIKKFTLNFLNKSNILGGVLGSLMSSLLVLTLLGHSFSPGFPNAVLIYKEKSMSNVVNFFKMDLLRLKFCSLFWDYDFTTWAWMVHSLWIGSGNTW